MSEILVSLSGAWSIYVIACLTNAWIAYTHDAVKKLTDHAERQMSYIERISIRSHMTVMHMQLFSGYPYFMQLPVRLLHMHLAVVIG